MHAKNMITHEKPNNLTNNLRPNQDVRQAGNNNHNNIHYGFDYAKNKNNIRNQRTNPKQANEGKIKNNNQKYIPNITNGSPHHVQIRTSENMN